MSKIKLGMTVKDIVTGLKGVVIGTTAWLTGCDQAIVQPPVNKDGEKPDTMWFDVNRLVILKAKIIKIPTYTVKDNGGMQHIPTKENR